jgi:hypothetical protein
VALLGHPVALAQPTEAGPVTATAVTDTAKGTGPAATTPTALPVPDAVRAGMGDLSAWRRLVERGREAMGEIERQLGRLEAGVARLRRLRGEIAPERAAQTQRDLRVPWYDNALSEAERRMAAGDHLGALKLIDAVLVLYPPKAARRRATELHLEARGLYIRQAIVRAELSPAKTLIGPNEPVRLILKLDSQASDPLVLRDEDGLTWPGQVEVEVLVASPSGDIFRHKTVKLLAVEVPEVLFKGKPWRTTIVLPLPGDDFGPDAFRRVSVRGSLHPEEIKRGDEVINGFLPLFRVPVAMAEQATHGLASSPLAELTLALKLRRDAGDPEAAERAERRVFFAAVLADRSHHNTIARLLFAAVRDEEDPAGAIAVTTLRVLADRPDLRDREDWLRLANRDGE